MTSLRGIMLYNMIVLYNIHLPREAMDHVAPGSWLDSSYGFVTRPKNRIVPVRRSRIM